MISFQCPFCNKEYKIAAQHAGKRTKCVCGKIITVPTLDETDQNTLTATNPHMFTSLEENAANSKVPKYIAIGAIGLCLSVVIMVVLWFMLRDTWEIDNRNKIEDLCKTVEKLANEDKAVEAIKKHEELIELIGKRELKNKELITALSNSHTATNTAKLSMQKQQETEQKQKKRREQKKQEEEFLAQISKIENESLALITSGKLDDGLKKYNEALLLFKSTTLQGQKIAETCDRILNAQKETSRKIDNKNKEEAKAKQKQAEDERVALEQRKVAEANEQYTNKCKDFYDSLYRTKSDLQVGINYNVYSERVRDMNFQYNKWLETLTDIEKHKTTSVLLEKCMKSYIATQGLWQDKLEQRHGSEEMVQVEIANARLLLEKYKSLKAVSGHIKEGPCGNCEGSGFFVCPICKGTGKCDQCETLTKVKDILCGHCIYAGERKKGYLRCPFCDGSGIFPPKEK